MCRSAQPPELAWFVEWETGVSGGDEPNFIQLGLSSRRVGAAARMERHTGRSLRDDRTQNRLSKYVETLPGGGPGVPDYTPAPVRIGVKRPALQITIYRSFGLPSIRSITSVRESARA